jgi:uncharacterized membrane protein YfcA
MNELLQSILLFGAGIFAGFINVNAGGGSTVTLPLLIFMGLDGATANGTNRLAILLQNSSAVYSFKEEKYSDIKLSIKLALFTLPGAIAGAFWAISIDDLLFKKILTGVIIFVIATLFIPKSKLLRKTDDKRVSVWAYLSMFVAGFYGGTIQAGVGFIFMTILHNLMKFDLIRVNMHKVFIIWLYTLPVLLIFTLSGNINWILGLSLAIGNMVGARLAVKFAVKKGEGAIRIILIFVMLLMAAKLINIF